ncbi:hypothetical protein FIBSPDRAFT_945016 [Athelia psychrophila]|uniref:Stress-response A/B barrel domain-containing protein n=1 Tax=Athelia psychrophila TaxID=1759441 RepID=A0A166UA80_9AGAM|nr:hypothetical protein FIBSPDRAFT_945016 [Fibularhizoctonia sp. CBS 109695]
MTIYHILLIKFKPEATAEQRQDWVTRLIQLGKTIPAVKAVNTGKKIAGTYDKGWDEGAVLLFDNAEGLQEYLPHADHLAFIAQGSEIVIDGTVFDIDTSES